MHTRPAASRAVAGQSGESARPLIPLLLALPPSSPPSARAPGTRHDSRSSPSARRRASRRPCGVVVGPRQQPGFSARARAISSPSVRFYELSVGSDRGSGASCGSQRMSTMVGRRPWVRARAWTWFEWSRKLQRPTSLRSRSINEGPDSTPLDRSIETCHASRLFTGMYNSGVQVSSYPRRRHTLLLVLLQQLGYVVGISPDLLLLLGYGIIRPDARRRPLDRRPPS